MLDYGPAGLFRGVIASSGSALDPWATTKRSLDVARALAKELGLQADTPAEVTKALRAVSTASLLKAAKTMPKICVSSNERVDIVTRPWCYGQVLWTEP